MARRQTARLRDLCLGRRRALRSEWRNGKQHGRGARVSADGNRYEDEWRDGKRHGRGSHIFANGNRYEGTWRGGRPHGVGTYTLAEGSVYEGNWIDGCYRARDGRWAVVNTTAAVCGFE